MKNTPQQHISNLGFRLIQPNPILSSYVRSYWCFHRDAPLLKYQEEYMHPLGRFGIGFNFSDAVYLDNKAMGTPIFLDGANTISRKMGFLGHIDMLGVSFHEGGAFPFLGIPLHELENEVFLLDILNKSDLMRLYSRMREKKSLQGRVNLLEEWLLARLRLGKEVNKLIPASISKLRQNDFVSIPNLAKEFSISQRQLERLYKSQVGISPKQYVQLLRIESARLALRHSSESSSVDLAHKLGFYDQAHFIREFKSVVGMTPYHYTKLRENKKA